MEVSGKYKHNSIIVFSLKFTELKDISFRAPNSEELQSVLAFDQVRFLYLHVGR